MPRLDPRTLFTGYAAAESITTPAEERRVIDAAQSGDADAFDRLLRAYSPLLKRSYSGAMLRASGRAYGERADDLQADLLFLFTEAVHDCKIDRLAGILPATSPGQRT
ncbi:hypothetical protein A0130_03175 [Leifsonia xyli]|uniref:helix-turn-helix domain-containing protein n=1 Tax=Leifsonia xyli TaxID=1575 RepID=UPI0007CDEA92|nr:hypothetical protein A0130_03175 [Leifsonia xyli]